MGGEGRSKHITCGWRGLTARWGVPDDCLPAVQPVQGWPAIWLRPHPAHLSASAPPPPPCSLSHRPRPSAAVVGPASLSQARPRPLSAYLDALPLCRWASTATLLRTVRRLARTCREGGDQYWKGEGSTPLSTRLTWEAGRGGHPPGQKVSQSCLLHVCGETGHQEGRPRKRPAHSQLSAFAQTMPSEEHIWLSRLLQVPYWSLGSPHSTLPWNTPQSL